VPLRAQLNNGVIESDANAAAHTHDHPLAVECRQAILEMLHEVLGNKSEARAVEDGATVPIYYESRLARIELDEDEKPKIDAEIAEAGW
jgi:hypothetical protein